MKEENVIVSACLLGVKCRYDGKDALSLEVDTLLKDATPIPVCPEELGGLPTPRKKAEIVGGSGQDVLEATAKVIDEEGTDVTAEFLKGAKEVLKIAQAHNATLALLKEGSPSCDVNIISRDGVTVEGVGVTTAILKGSGIKVVGVK